jgi:phage terminase small subunit
MVHKPTTFDDALKTLTKRQALFIVRYLETLNAKKAAIEAGYSAKTAHSIGHENLNKPELKSIIELGFNQKVMSRGEVLNRFQKIATGTMEDFITLEEIEYQERVPVPAFERREQLQARIASAIEQLEKAKQKAHKDAWKKIIDDTEAEINDLPDNPLEAVTVLGNIRKTVVARVDLVKAEKLGKLGLLKKVKQTERGLEIELYAADSALEMLGKYHKLFAERVSLENGDGSPVQIINIVPIPARDLGDLDD